MSNSSQDARSVGISVTNAIQCNLGNKRNIIDVKKEALAAWKDRSHQMNRLLDHINSNISSIYETENQQFLDDLNNFIKSRSKGKLGHVPTAHVKLAMNVADNQLLAQMIEASVTKQRVALFVVRLSSEDCWSFSSIKSKISRGLIEIGIGSSDPEEEETIDKTQLQDLSFPFLALARKQLIKDPRPIVVIIDDVENCGNKPGLDSFLISAQQSLDHLNIVIVLCCYTGCLTLQQLLPTLSCDTMYLSSFNPRSPRNVFQQLMNKVILTPDIFTFKLSPRCLQLIVDDFVFVDISISRVKVIMKACLFRHFHSSPLILSFKTEEELTKALMSLPKKELNSLLKDISKLPSAKGIGVLTREAVISRLKEIHAAHLNLIDLSRCLYLIAKDLPGSGLPSTITGILISFLGSNDYGQSADVEETIRSLGFLSFEEFKRKLDICFNNASKYGPSEFLHILNQEREILIKFKEDDIVPKPMKPISESEIGPCKTRSEWKDKMKKKIAATPKVLSKFEIWRKNFLSRITKYLHQTSSPYFMPLKELIYFDDVDYVVDHIFPSSREEIIEELKNPLGHGEENEIVVSKAHQMIQENEGKVDMGELLENFKVEMEFENKKKRGTNKKNIDTKIATFITSMYDLDYIGMIQKDKQRPNTFTKATWEM